MQKNKKIIMRVVAALLVLVIITTCFLSSVYAKYVTGDSFEMNLSFKKMGVTVVASANDVKTDYVLTSDGSYLVDSTVNVLAPGTKGVLVAFEVSSSSSEVNFGLDFKGTLNIGDGYRASSGVIRDADGYPVEYFPIILCCYRSDITTAANGTKTYRRNFLSSYCVQRVDKDGTQHAYFGTDSWSDMDAMFDSTNGINATGKYLDTALDSTGFKAGDSMNSIYSVEWVWPYDSSSEYPNKGVGTLGTYQQADYDGQLGEAMLRYSHTNLFKISLTLGIAVKQEQ
jgi:hypothetical protein